MAESRNHHYIPQGYLRGFARKRGKHYMVVVHDLGNKKAFETNTRNVCAQRDFMRFEAKDRKPDWLEEEFSKLESAAVEAIREVVKTGGFDGDDRNSILNLMALLAVRSPEQRENMRQCQERVARGVMDLVLAEKERWHSQLEQLKEATGQPPLVTYEEAKDFHERGEYTIEVPREQHIQTEIDLYNTLLELLGERDWTLYLVSGDEGELVTTNRPVVIAYTNPEEVPALFRHSPGFGLKNTEVYFPLAKHAALIGRWGGEYPAIVSPATQAFIGAFNNLMIQNSYGLVMSSARKVLYCDPLVRLQWDDKVIERFTAPPSAEEMAQFRAEHGIDDVPEAGPKV
ncbi:DUF4238 domain-containing protein [Variovorax sp. M-6]|uniref:DUF4238 domain-containing protein n=1 Tax=Variovorax sp. M-6 TaxID=3233041 RepID=UPI003F975BA2